MYNYSFIQWLLFFFIYCFLGWIWESCYVSAKGHKWVNRGFLHGPMLPIYGTGAITVLLATIPVRDNLLLVFILGMLAATVLEYFTGEAMEALFHVRYWDYSYERFNIKGHICLKCSIAWGFFSILMIRALHLPIERLVMAMPSLLAQIITYLVTVTMAVDATASFREAMDLKELLKHMAENSLELNRMRKRLDVVIAIIDSDRKALMDRLQGSLEAIEAKASEKKEQLDNGGMLPEWPYVEALTDLSEGIKSCINQITEMKQSLSEKKLPDYKDIIAELEGFKEKLLVEKKYSEEQNKKRALSSLRMLRRNPSAVSDKYSQFLEEIKERSGRKRS